MEGPIFPSNFPFRPIPVYGQRTIPEPIKPPVQPAHTAPTDPLLQLSKQEDRSALAKQLDVLNRMHHVRAFGEYHLGQLHALREASFGHLYEGLSKFNRNLPVSNPIAVYPSENIPSENRPALDFSSASKSPEAASDRLTVPVLVSCPNPFASQYGYGRKVFPCPQCRYTTDRRNNLKRHMLTMHQTCSKVLECCGILFATKASLREHAMIFHYHGYTCYYCGRRFCRKALLKRHLSVHNGQKDFVCTVCDYATSHKSNLERHRKVHCRPEDGKFDECEYSSDQFSPSADPWKSSGDSHVSEHGSSDVLSYSSDNENDEEIIVDSDD